MRIIRPVKVRIRAFAAYRELLGREELALDLADGSTVGAAFESLFRARADFARLQRSTLFAVNRQYVALDHVLAEGDELALIPPVAGGSR